MDLDRIKKHLQTYLETVISPKVNKNRAEMGLDPINFSVYDVIKGSFQPPIHHIFLDTEPEIRKKSGLKPHTIMMMDSVQKDINDFFKFFSIVSPTKVHWNKRPIFKNDTLHTEN